MKNLAGNPEADHHIERELFAAGIEVVRHPERLRGEVPRTLTGKLGPFTFDRAWYYWMVHGPVPLPVAEELYAHPYGQTDVRVAGHCGCPPPAEWVDWLDADGKELAPLSERPADEERARQCEKNLNLRFVESVEAEGKPFVTSYHIDTPEGLRLFVGTLRKHGLVGGEVSGG